MRGDAREWTIFENDSASDSERRLRAINADQAFKFPR